MSDSDEHDFFRLRKQAKTYVSKVFSWKTADTEKKRNVKIVFEGNDQMLLGEIDGILCLRLSGEKRKTQVSALVTQDDKKIKRVTLQKFVDRSGDAIFGYEKEEFTFRSDEFSRLVAFLNQIQFIDLSNEDNFQIEDISSQAGPKAIIDASDSSIVQQIKRIPSERRSGILQSLLGSLSHEEINLLLGRKQGMKEFDVQFRLNQWSETEWQDFFEREEWVFGYGLDYRIVRQFDRELTVGAGGADNRGRPVVDFLMQFTDYTVLVEVKKPDTPLFKRTKGGRAGTREFSSQFTSAVSQILEQKAEWLSFAQSGEHYDKSGNNRLEARTRNTKSILVIGSTQEFDNAENARESQVMRDTFELYRREFRGIDIITFDELLHRARYITRDPADGSGQSNAK
jgi:hypothetical protein